MEPNPADDTNMKELSLAREVALQAELLALNVAVGGEGAPQVSEALYALSRELRQAKSGGRAGLRLEP